MNQKQEMVRNIAVVIGAIGLVGFGITKNFTNQKAIKAEMSAQYSADSISMVDSFSIFTNAGDFIKANDVISHYGAIHKGTYLEQVSDSLHQLIKGDLSRQTDSLRAEILKHADFIAGKVKRLRVDKDKFRKVSFFYHKTSPKYSDINGLYLYFSINDDSTLNPPRLRVQYTATTWLFIKECLALTDNEKVYDLGFADWERDNESRIWEYSDKQLTDDELIKLKEMLESKTITLRFNGSQYYKERKLKQTELSAIKEMVYLYEQLRDNKEALVKSI